MNRLGLPHVEVVDRNGRVQDVRVGGESVFVREGAIHLPVAMAFAMCGFLSWGCGAKVAGNGPADASSYADGSGGKRVDASSDGGGEGTSLPACSWPAIYDAPDSSTFGTTGQCVASRVLLSCAGSNGGSEECASDNPTQCPGPNATPGVTYSNCQNQCRSDEYALFCGTIGPSIVDASATNTPPANCLGSAPNGGGREPFCCPCSP
jgi:hypothetical protein